MRVKAQETRPVLRIFISSTAVDLIDYREKVRDAVLRLEDLPIAMETFSASGQPAEECMRMADTAKNDELRAKLLEMAQEWLSLAIETDAKGPNGKDSC